MNKQEAIRAFARLAMVLGVFCTACGPVSYAAEPECVEPVGTAADDGKIEAAQGRISGRNSRRIGLSARKPKTPLYHLASVAVLAVCCQPVSPCKPGKCREISQNCRESAGLLLQKASASQSVR
jgi:hypothetical protein